MSCGVGHRSGSDPVLLWLWYGLAATALTGPQAWELPYAAGAPLKSKEKKIAFFSGKHVKTHRTLRVSLAAGYSQAWEMDHQGAQSPGVGGPIKRNTPITTS